MTPYQQKIVDFRPQLIRYIHSLQSPCEPEVVAQEAILKVLEKEGTYDDRNIPGLLCRTARNIIISHWRRRRTVNRAFDLLQRAEHDSFEEPMTPEDHMIHNELHPELVDALSRIPSEFREVITRIAKGTSYKEIADELGIAYGTVMSRAFRARKRLLKDPRILVLGEEYALCHCSNSD